MITVLTGSNSFALNVELKRLVADFVKEYGDIALEKVDGEEVEYQKIVESIQSLPFLSARRLVVLRNPSAHKAFMEDFEKLTDTIPENSDILIVEPKVDKRTSYFKQLKKMKDFYEFSELDEMALQKWAVKFALEAGGQISSSDAAHLINLLGPSQQLLASELQKLLNYNPKIDRSSIDELIEPMPQSTVFELMDAALSGNSKKALKIYGEQRLARVEPQEIMGMIAWQLHVLALIKAAGNKTPDQIASEAKLHPFVVRKGLNITKNLSMQRIKKLVSKATEIDYRSKTEGIDIDEALKNYLIELSK